MLDRCQKGPDLVYAECAYVMQRCISLFALSTVYRCGMQLSVQLRCVIVDACSADKPCLTLAYSWGVHACADAIQGS